MKVALIAAVLLFACVAAASVGDGGWGGYTREQLESLSDKYLHKFRAPVIESVERLSNPEDGPKRPVVMMHGLGDAGHNAGMASLAKSVTEAYPGTYSIAVDVADGLASFFTLIDDQVDQFAQTVRADPKLANGFNAVGLSQGGLIVRAYVSKYNDPPVYNLISICGPQDGVGTCPAGTPGFICDIFRLGPYTAKLSFAGYWKDVAYEEVYLQESTFLADLNNERDVKNSTYVDNLLSVNKYVAIMALGDTVVQPRESAQHGFWKWNDTTYSQVETIFETQAFQEDWIGLKSMVDMDKLDMYNFTGEHIRFSQQFWESVVLPYFNNTASDPVETLFVPVSAPLAPVPVDSVDVKEDALEAEALPALRAIGDALAPAGDRSNEDDNVFASEALF